MGLQPVHQAPSSTGPHLCPAYPARRRGDCQEGPELSRPGRSRRARHRPAVTAPVVTQFGTLRGTEPAEPLGTAPRSRVGLFHFHFRYVIHDVPLICVGSCDRSHVRFRFVRRKTSTTCSFGMVAPSTKPSCSSQHGKILRHFFSCSQVGAMRRCQPAMAGALTS